MFFAGLAPLLLLSLGSLYFLWRFFGKWPVERPARVLQDQFGTADAVAAILLAGWWLNMAWDGFSKPHPPVSTMMVAATAILYLFIVIMITGLLMVRGRNPVAMFGLRWSGWKQSLPLCWLALLAAYPILLTTQMIVQHFLGASATAQDVLEFLKASHGWKDRVLIIVMAVFCAPLAEETIFRGFLYGVGRQYLGRGISLIGTSLIFALIHAHLPSLAGLFLFAILLTLVYEKTGSLWASMALHATFNAVTIVFTLLWPDMPS